MDKEFEQFLSNIQLTQKQNEDAQAKYNGVCKKLHDNFYENEYNGSTKFLFGSYKTKTNIRPLAEDQDVDIIFKMPEDQFNKYDDYESNGQVALLQKIREILKEKYTTSEKVAAWGKVVLIKFADGTHNIEVLPGWEKSNGKYEIPNTEDGGSWEIFDPKKDIDQIKEANKETDGLAIKLCKIIKKWKRNTASLSIKSYQVFNSVLDFLEANKCEDEPYLSILIFYYQYLKKNIDNKDKSQVATAISRLKNTNEFIKKGDKRKASLELRKIFGDAFPVAEDNNKDEKIEPVYVKSERINKRPEPWRLN